MCGRGVLRVASDVYVSSGRPAMLNARVRVRARCESTNLVDPASSHMLVSKVKPCMSQYKLPHGKTANGSLKQLQLI